MPLSDLPFRLHEFDAVISCTASTLPLIGLGAVEKALKLRRHRPMFMVDLAVPRDIEPEIKNLSDVYLYTVDDLAGLVQTGKAQRQAAVLEAETIIEASVDSFAQWLHQRDPLQGVVPLIQQLQSQTEGWRLAELARAKKALAKGESVETVLDNLTKGLTQKMLHGPLTELRSVEAVSRDRASEAIRLFFLRQER
jgi:glutamyl-tRNA reductase